MVEIYYLSDCARDGSPPGLPTGRSFVITDFDLFEEAFSHLRMKTGVSICECGDVRLYPNHQRLLVDYLVFTGSANPELKAFIDFLSQSSEDNAVLFFVGD